jgi:hypothetical protein
MLTAFERPAFPGDRVADNRIYRHPKRPEWGMAVFREQVEDRALFMFEDLQVRAFKAHLLNVLEIVHLPEDESAPLLSKLQKKTVTRGGVRKKKAPAKKEPKVSKAKESDADASS